MRYPFNLNSGQLSRKNSSVAFRRIGFAIAATLIFSLSAHAQSDTAVFKSIAAKTFKLPSEHIYLHLNKPRYERADTIWFRMYTVTDGHKLSAVSKTAYAELVSPKDSVVQRLNLKLEAGMASGDFALPITLSAGTYRLRAYTNWMKNQGEESFYDQQIVIGNPGKENGSATIDHGQKTPDLQFFPEGGDLVEGLRNVVAYKAVNADGSPAKFTATVTGIDGQVIAELESNNMGTGLFAITPQANENYMAKVTFANGSTLVVNLPKAAASGYTLTINNHDNDTLQIKIAANAELLKTANGQGFYLTAEAGNEVYYTTTGKTDATAYKIKIAKNRLPAGISKFTLSAQNGEPLNERIIFVQSMDNLDLKLAAEKAGDNSNSILLTVNNQDSKAPSAESFSATVFNDDKVPFDEQAAPTIMNLLLQSNELHGRVNNAGYYLANADAMDLLMLTQGYRKLEWKKTENIQPKYLAENGLSVSGELTTPRDKAIANGTISLLSTQQLVKIDTTTDAAGKFLITDLDVTGKTPVMIKAANGKSKDVKLVIDNYEKAVPHLNTPLFSDESTMPAPLAATIQKSYQDEAKNFDRLKGRVLQDVDIKDKATPKAQDISSSRNLNGAGHADVVIYGKDMMDAGCTNLIDCIGNRVPSVQIVPGPPGGGIRYIGRGALSKRLGNPPPMKVYIDGAQGSFNDISSSEVYSVEVLTSAHYEAIYGTDASFGLILITTKRGIPANERIAEKEPGVFAFNFNGYYKTRTFYQPKYQEGDAGQPSAIYWKPDVLTDKDGKATLNFNNAGKGHYRMVVEGIDSDGRLGHAEYKYEVK